MSDAIKRGENLLKPFGLALEDVQAISLSRKRFENVATARQFVKLHGMGAARVSTTPHHFVFEVSPVDKFDSDTLRIENISRDVAVSAGARKNAGRDFDLDIEVVEPAATASEQEVLSALAQVGDLFRISKQSDAEDAPVRTIGIVLKPETADSQGSLISETEIEQANLEFMRDFGTVGLMHQTSVSDKVFIIQNAIAPCDIAFETPSGNKVVSKGTWYQEHYTADPEIAGKIRRGELTGLSIGGFAKHVPLEKRACVEYSDVEKAASEPVAKGEATHRLVNLSVQEVSLVDVAANEERFLVVRRKVTKVVPPSSASTEDKRQAQRQRSATYGIEALEGKGENLSFPAGEPTDEALYGDPVNLKYQMGDSAHAANARVRFKQNADTYTRDSSKKIVHERIVRRELALGITPDFNPDDPLDAMLPSDLKDRLQQSAAPAAAKEASMQGQETEQAAGAAPEASAPVAEATPSSQEPVVKAEDAAPQGATETQVAPVPAAQLDLAALVAEAVSKAVEAAIAPLAEKVSSLEGQLAKQAESVQKSAVVLALAKGESIPATTAVVEKAETKSMWAGSVIHRVGKKTK